jgi:hypothetical protein
LADGARCYDAGTTAPAVDGGSPVNWGRHVGDEYAQAPALEASDH